MVCSLFRKAAMPIKWATLIKQSAPAQTAYEILMAVNTFDPQQVDPAGSSSPLDTALIDQAVRLAGALSETNLELSLTQEEVAAMGPLIVHPAWSEQAEELPADQLVALIRLFTLGEGQFSSWRAGAKSAVIKLVRALKVRKEMPPELTAWIKAHSDNRFLPHGDLMDRL